MADTEEDVVLTNDKPSFGVRLGRIVRSIIVGVSFGIVTTAVLLVVYRDEVDAFLTSACTVVIDEKMDAGLCSMGEQGLDCSGKSRSVFGQGGNLSDPH